MLINDRTGLRLKNGDDFPVVDESPSCCCSGLSGCSGKSRGKYGLRRRGFEAHPPMVMVVWRCILNIWCVICVCCLL